MDEAGRGPLAGPVVASAVIVRDFSFRCAVDDSKMMSAEAREAAYEEIHEKCEVAFAVVEHDVIDEINILRASLKAMSEAILKLPTRPDFVLVDGPHVPEAPMKRQAVIDGDALSFSIACASIVAKVTRDRIMEEADRAFPQYGFRRHKGYGTPEHLEALKAHGPCDIHRKTFEPVRILL